MANIRTHYDNLRVARNAPDSVIKAAYKALCQTYHPDKFQGSNAEAERIMKLINASYMVLIDPVKRAEHDAWIQVQETETNQPREKATFGETGNETEQKFYQKQETKWKYTSPSTEPEPPKTKASPLMGWQFGVQMIVVFVIIKLVGLLGGLVVWVIWSLITFVIKKYASPKANISPHEWRGYFAHLAEKVSIIKSYIALFFKIFGYQIVVALVYMFGSVDLVPNFSGLINFPFFDFIITFLFSMLAPALIVYIALIPFHLIFIWLKKPLPLYTQAIIALLSLSLVILDFTKINPLLTGYRGLGAYNFTPSIMQNAQQVTSLITNSAKDVVQEANKLYNQGKFEEAFPLLQGLAKQGNAQAQYNLGYMYESGNGITKNNYLAIYWYNQAAKLGDPDAIAALKKLGQ